MNDAKTENAIVTEVKRHLPILFRKAKLDAAVKKVEISNISQSILVIVSLGKTGRRGIAEIRMLTPIKEITGVDVRCGLDMRGGFSFEKIGNAEDLATLRILRAVLEMCESVSNHEECFDKAEERGGKANVYCVICDDWP